MLEMKGFAVARRRPPQTPKWLDGLIDGLNLTPEKFTPAAGRLALDGRRVRLAGCQRLPARPSGGLGGAFNARQRFRLCSIALGW